MNALYVNFLTLFHLIGFTRCMLTGMHIDLIIIFLFLPFLCGRDIHIILISAMSVSFIYWDDCVDPEDMRVLWADRAVSKEWIDANERKGHRVHLSRDPDGEPYLTQTEMRVNAFTNVLND